MPRGIPRKKKLAEQILSGLNKSLNPLGLSLLSGVFWAQLKPPMSNYALVAGWIFISWWAILFLNKNIRSRRRKTRWAAWILLPTAIGLSVYTLLWVPAYELSVRATTTHAPAPEGVVISGFVWSEKYSEVRLVLSNPSEEDFTDVDLMFNCDAPIAKFGVASGSAELSFYDNPETVDVEFQYPSSGSRTKHPVVVVASELGIRIRTQALPRDSRIEIVFAAVTMRDGKSPPSDDDILIKIGMSNGRSVWFASDRHTDWVFQSKPSVGSGSLDGRFTAKGRENRVSWKNNIIDPVGLILKNGGPSK